MKLVAVQLVLIAALILTLNITLTLGQNDVTLLENEENDDNVIEKDAVSQNIHKSTIFIEKSCCLSKIGYPELAENGFKAS